MIVYDDRVATFVGKLTGTTFDPPYVGIGIEEDGRVIAGMVFNIWTGPDIHVSVAALKGRLRRSLIRAAGRYVFGQLECCRATLLTESPLVLKYGLRLGAADEGLCRNQFGMGRDGFRLAFHRDDWRF